MATPFTSILCGVEGNPASTEAARQAIALAGSGRRPPVHRRLHELRTRPRLPQGRAREQPGGGGARWPARRASPPPMSCARRNTRSTSCCPKASEHDLLVLGTHGNSRASGILFGSTASEAAHGAERPLLIAREAPGPEPFPKDILVASDGTHGLLGAGPGRRRARRLLRRQPSTSSMSPTASTTSTRRPSRRSSPRSPRRPAATRS